MKFKLLKKSISIVLILTLLAGCGSNLPDLLNVEEIKPGETISKDSKWINSNIVGAIVEETPVNLKDDFNTAVNKKWLLETELKENQSKVSSIGLAVETINRRLLAIAEGRILEDEIDINAANFDSAQIGHVEKTVITFADLAKNWSQRNQLGVEPARPYIEAITQINSIEDMNAYIKNENGLNFTLDQIIPFEVGTPFNDRDFNTVFIQPYNNFALGSSTNYLSITAKTTENQQINDEVVKYVLERLGFSSSEIKKVLKENYIFEGKLANSMASEMSKMSSEYYDLADNAFTLQQIKEIQGNYPLADILEIYGLHNSNRYTVLEPDYVKKVGKLYKQSNLEEIKSFYLVKTIRAIQPLLDREAFENYFDIVLDDATKETINGDETEEKTTEERDVAILLQGFVSKYLREPLEMLYVDLYCSEKQKQEIINVVELTREYFIDMIRENDWLANSTKIGAVEKLENMRMNAVYPDEFTDFKDLDISSSHNLVEAVAIINSFEKQIIQRDVNKAIKDNKWDLNIIPLTEVNAYYYVMNNSVNILPGILASPVVYRSDMEFEELLAGIGVIIGHEITHAFDTNGYNYDKDGRSNSWWNYNDRTTFSEKAYSIEQYYAKLTPYPGATSYSADVKGEAIADFGGVKAMLAIAANQKDFNYELFFESYARLWQEKATYEYIVYSAVPDVHPLNFLRINVVLQQFDEFLETYDIKEGDGMYLAPENRITLW